MDIKNMKINFFEKLNSIDDIEYMKCFITYLISPIITGIKPASTVSLNNTRNMYDIWTLYGKDLLKELNLDSIVLKESSQTAIILIYNQELLEEHLLVDKNKRFLSDLGYCNSVDINNCLNCLKSKFEDIEFPNESGIFLGIPIEDVLGFIDKKDCLYSGYWKVYDNYDRAKKVFKLYDNSKRAVISSFLKDNDLGLVHKKISHIYKNKLYTVVNC